MLCLYRALTGDFNRFIKILTNLKNEKLKFQAALKRNLNKQSIHSIDQFLMCTDDL
jgi:hypothetical protein